MLPILYGELHCTGQEIAALTPWEIERRIDGYMKQVKVKRVLIADLVTVPILNAAGHPKHPILLQQIVPDVFQEAHAAPKDQVESLKRFAEEQERRRGHGRP